MPQLREQERHAHTGGPAEHIQCNNCCREAAGLGKHGCKGEGEGSADKKWAEIVATAVRPQGNRCRCEKSAGVIQGEDPANICSGGVVKWDSWGLQW